jgi:hypothetical protein
MAGAVWQSRICGTAPASCQQLLTAARSLPRSLCALSWPCLSAVVSVLLLLLLAAL